VQEVTAHEVVMDLGGRTGVISRRHLTADGRGEPTELVAVGDELEAAVLVREDPQNRVVLSRAWAVKQRAWQAIMQALLERRRASERQDRAREAQTVDRLEALERVSAEVRFVNQQIITDYSQAFRQSVRELDWLNYLEDRHTFLTAEDKAELRRRQEQLQ